MATTYSNIFPALMKLADDIIRDNQTDVLPLKRHDIDHRLARYLNVTAGVIETRMNYKVFSVEYMDNYDVPQRLWCILYDDANKLFPDSDMFIFDYGRCETYFMMPIQAQDLEYSYAANKGNGIYGRTDYATLGDLLMSFYTLLHKIMMHDFPHFDEFNIMVTYLDAAAFSMLLQPGSDDPDTKEIIKRTLYMVITTDAGDNHFYEEFGKKMSAGANKRIINLFLEDAQTLIDNGCNDLVEYTSSVAVGATFRIHTKVHTKVDEEGTSETDTKPVQSDLYFHNPLEDYDVRNMDTSKDQKVLSCLKRDGGFSSKVLGDFKDSMKYITFIDDPDDIINLPVVKLAAGGHTDPDDTRDKLKQEFNEMYRDNAEKIIGILDGNTNLSKEDKESIAKWIIEAYAISLTYFDVGFITSDQLAVLYNVYRYLIKNTVLQNFDGQNGIDAIHLITEIVNEYSFLGERGLSFRKNLGYRWEFMQPCVDYLCSNSPVSVLHFADTVSDVCDIFEYALNSMIAIAAHGFDTQYMTTEYNEKQLHYIFGVSSWMSSVLIMVKTAAITGVLTGNYPDPKHCYFSYTDDSLLSTLLFMVFFPAAINDDFYQSSDIGDDLKDYVKKAAVTNIMAAFAIINTVNEFRNTDNSLNNILNTVNEEFAMKETYLPSEFIDKVEQWFRDHADFMNDEFIKDIFSHFIAGDIDSFINIIDKTIRDQPITVVPRFKYDIVEDEDDDDDDGNDDDNGNRRDTEHVGQNIGDKVKDLLDGLLNSLN